LHCAITLREAPSEGVADAVQGHDAWRDTHAA